ncbi:MAG: DUF975 family protein [Blautia sp.]|nr:DUF975 family protein [Blautia sp.]
MDKNSIFARRKEIKKKSHQVVRKHYIRLFFLTLALFLLGNELTLSRGTMGDSYGELVQFVSTAGSFTSDRITSGKKASEEAAAAESAGTDDPGSLLDNGSVWDDIINGNIERGEERAKEQQEQLKAGDEQNKALGHTNGLLAGIVNGVSSGTIISKLAQTAYSIFHSSGAVAVLFIVFSMLFYLLFYIFIQNIYSAAIRRVYLEARVYDKVSFTDVFYFVYVRQWIHASIVMFVTTVYNILWGFTIIGGAVKMFSYWAVPYIMAENPSIKTKDAITLSRKMMDGHKIELLKMNITLLGWTLLGFITFGITDILYGLPYKLACGTEFYAEVRELAKKNKVEGVELLDDKYLYKKADRILLYETYFDVVDEITLLHEGRMVLSRAKKIAADWFGIWLGTLEEKRKYEDQEARILAIENHKLSMEGKTYPLWLNKRWPKKELEKKETFSFLRVYSIWTLFLLFISFSFIGWLWEVALHYMQTGELANRGTMFGPWLPIYGSGGVVVLLLCSRFRKNIVAEFFTSVILCGIIEYTAAWYLEMKFNTRWWSYDGYFLNLHGRICAEGLLIFGIGCCLVVYTIAPFFDYLLSKLKNRILIPICIALAVLFSADLVFASIHPNMAKGAVEETRNGSDG